ncbi:serine hydrolase domain-containing protein [Nocardia sp. NPDC051030]|uniref:serine hydrolase domain-containing protein n=1 Tax=Nocardia sp. NPDC051030 TaxID=3155162 RepID=UPI003413E02D
MRIMPMVTVLALGAAAGCSTMATTTPKTITSTPVAVSPKRVGEVRSDIDALVRSGFTGVIATLTENGQTVTLTAGVADRTTNASIPLAPPQEVRVGSIAKTFVASITLQLVAEGRVHLDDPVDTYLPGLLTGNGVDGRNITVRQLLQHRSGLPELTDTDIDEYRAGVQGLTYTPAQEVALALTLPAQFAPGTRFKYTNTNYIVAAMLIEKVTGRPYSEELAARITTPHGLPGTYLPATGELDLRTPHPQGYATINGVRTDVTRTEPSVPWAAGGLVSTGADLNRFYLALLSAQVVPTPQLQEMLTLQPEDPQLEARYGIGIASTDLTCPTQYFGHNGGITGFSTITGATKEGRAVTITITDSVDSELNIKDLISHALCP